MKYKLILFLISEIILCVLCLMLFMYYFKLDFLVSINLISNIYTIQSLLLAIIFLILTNKHSIQIETSISKLHEHVTNNSMNEL